MTLITEPILGLEMIQRAALKIFFDQLNGALTQVSDYMGASDQDLAAHMGLPYTPLAVEPVLPENFYEGHRPSLIDAPIENYPNLSVWSARVSADAESALMDQMTITNTSLVIEVMCKAAPEEGEGVVNKRLLRTIEAVCLCVISNPTLRGLVNGNDSEPTVDVSEVFTRKERTAYGPHWYWQGSRIEFLVRKESAPPSSHVGASNFLRTLHADSAPLQAAQPESGIPALDYSQFIDQG